MSVQARLNRLFSPQGKCFDVAIDHGFFNEYSFLSGIENIKKAIETIVRANPDAIQLTVGQAHILQSIPGKHKPSLVLRTDVALPNQPELYHQCVKNICRLKPECEKYGMPLMVEPLVMQPNEKAGGYMVDGDIAKIVPLVRQAVELGADIIKADPCDHVEEYHKVIEAASGKPVLPRGGGRVSDEEIFTRTYLLMQQGASGIVYGRNVLQHPHPEAMTRALMAIVHDGADPARAMAILRGENSG